jgi:hypothetical protein
MARTAVVRVSLHFLFPEVSNTMMNTQMQERSSWSIAGSDVADELSELMGVSDEESELLSSLETDARGRARAMTDDFYDRLFSHDHTKEYFEGQDMDRLHEMIGSWFTELFSGDYSAEYVENRLKIGHIHVQIGLPVRYPLAMIDIITRHGEAVTAESPDPEAAQAAFRKVMALDVAIFNQAYEDNQLKHLAELVGGERLARRLLMGKA